MKRYWVLVVGALFGLAGCGSSNEPSTSELEKKLALDLKGYVEVASFSKEISENAGTKVEPLVQTRFKAKLRLKEDTYVPSGYVRRENAVQLELRNKKGTEFDLYGIAKATRKGDGWNITFRYENMPSNIGQPFGHFSAQGKAFIKGSKEEEEFMAQIKEKAADEAMASASRALQQAVLKEQEQARKSKINSMLMKHVSDKKIYSGQIRNADNLVESKYQLMPVKLSFDSLDQASGTVSGRLAFISSPNAEFHRGRNSVTYGYLPIKGVVSNGKLRIVTPSFAGCSAMRLCDTGFSLMPNEAGSVLEDKEGNTTMKLSL